jgi:hypothetical protein
MTLHEVFTPFENNISECESKQVHNVIIFSLTDLFNGLLDISDMHFWITLDMEVASFKALDSTSNTTG